MGVLIASSGGGGGGVPVIQTAPTLSPTTAGVGVLLTSTTGSWTNSPTSYAYRWLRGGSPISGATSSTYTTTGADDPSTITCEVLASNATGPAAAYVATSNSCSVTTGAPGIPVIQIAPTINITTVGNAGVDITCSTGSWTNSPTSYQYQWMRGNFDILNPYTPADGGGDGGNTTPTRRTTAADVPSVLKCKVRATNASGSAVAYVTSSNACTVAGGAVPVNSVAPTISAASAGVGTILYCSKGSWTTGANLPTGFHYQWMRGGVDISGATGAAYKTQKADNLSSLTCRVRAYNDSGNAASYTTTSNSCTVTDSTTVGIVSQTIVFGDLTLAAAGRAIPAYGGTISNASITGGSLTGWNVDTTTGAVWKTSGAYGAGTLNVTYTINSVAYPVVLTISLDSNVYSVASSTEFNSVISSVAVATLSGKTIKCRTGTYTPATITNKAYTSNVTITRHTGAFPIFEETIVSGSSRVKFLNIEFYKDGDGNGALGVLLTLTGGCSNTVVDACEFHARYFDNTLLWGGEYKPGSSDSDYIPPVQRIEGFQGESGGNSITITNSSFHDLARGVLAQTGQLVTVSGNTFYNICGDCMQWPNQGGGPSTVFFTNNTCYDFWWASPASHSDVFQFVGSSGDVGDYTVNITGNRCVQTIQIPFTTVFNFLGHQGVLLGNMGVGCNMMGTISQNLWAGGQGINVSVDYAKNLTVQNNTIVRRSTTGVVSPNLSIGGSPSADRGGNVISKNVAEYILNDFGTSVITQGLYEGNYVMGTYAATAVYVQCFDGLAGSFVPLSVADALVMFKRKSTGPLMPDIGCDL